MECFRRLGSIGIDKASSSDVSSSDLRQSPPATTSEKSSQEKKESTLRIGSTTYGEEYVSKLSTNLDLAYQTQGRRLEDMPWLQENLDRARADFDIQWNAQITCLETIRNFTLIKTLGFGSFGRVMLAQYNQDSSKRSYAIKILSKEMIVRSKQVTHVMNEKRILQSVNSPFIVKLAMSFKDTTNLYLVMEFVNGGDLFHLLKIKGKLPEEWAQFYAAQILLALQYLHNIHIIYRDIKPENILIDNVGYLKLTDFGFAKMVRGHTWTLCGTPQYLAPEIILSRSYGKSVDYWGLGILIYELVAGRVPFDHKVPIKLYEMIVEGKPDYPPYFKPLHSDLLANLIQVDVTKRYGNLKNGALDIINHSWFKDINFRQILSREMSAPWISPVRSPTDTSNFDKVKEETITISKFDKFPEEFRDF